MSRSYKKYWKKLKGLHLTHRYVYPEKIGNLIVEIQDPGKHLREARLLQKYLPKHCGEILLDYGCGDGKMFRYIREYYKKYPSLIVGIDPDYTRLIKAREKLLSDGGGWCFLKYKTRK